MRVSDAERQRTLEELARHCRAGRIDLAEYGTRVERVMAASVLADLDGALSDLPMMRIADPDRPAGRGQGAWGTRVLLVVTVLVLASVLVLAILAQWALTGVLLAGWVLGMAQGRIGLPGRAGRRR